MGRKSKREEPLTQLFTQSLPHHVTRVTRWERERKGWVDDNNERDESGCSLIEGERKNCNSPSSNRKCSIERREGKSLVACQSSLLDSFPFVLSWHSLALPDSLDSFIVSLSYSCFFPSLISKSSRERRQFLPSLSLGCLSSRYGVSWFSSFLGIMGVNLLYCLSVSLWCLLYTRIRRFFHSLSPKIDLSISSLGEKIHTSIQRNASSLLLAQHNFHLSPALPSFLSVHPMVSHSFTLSYLEERQTNTHSHTFLQARRKTKERRNRPSPLSPSHSPSLWKDRLIELFQHVRSASWAEVVLSSLSVVCVSLLARFGVSPNASHSFAMLCFSRLLFSFGFLDNREERQVNASSETNGSVSEDPFSCCCLSFISFPLFSLDSFLDVVFLTLSFSHSLSWKEKFW